MSDDDVVAVILDLVLTEKEKRETTLAVAEVSLVPAVQIVNDKTRGFFFFFFLILIIPHSSW